MTYSCFENCKLVKRCQKHEQNRNTPRLSLAVVDFLPTPVGGCLLCHSCAAKQGRRQQIGLQRPWSVSVLLLKLKSSSLSLSQSSAWYDNLTIMMVIFTMISVITVLVDHHYFHHHHHHHHCHQHPSRIWVQWANLCMYPTRIGPLRNLANQLQHRVETGTLEVDVTVCNTCFPIYQCMDVGPSCHFAPTFPLSLGPSFFVFFWPKHRSGAEHIANHLHWDKRCISPVETRQVPWLEWFPCRTAKIALW